MKLIDISQPLRKGIPVWPDDTGFSFDLVQTMEQGSSVNVGRIEMSVHTGTHVDAPFHFDDAGERVLDLDPGIYVGPARVIEADAEAGIGAAELREHDLAGAERLLLKTGSWTDRDAFPKSITHLRPDAAPHLAENGVRLVGVDTPSVDPLDSKDLPTHHALHARGIYILEGLVLDAVEPGDYELFALPLPLRGADGSPVRAVLRTRG